MSLSGETKIYQQPRSTRWLGFRCCTHLSLLCTCLDLRDRTLLQPQSKFVRATCLSVYPRHIQWYHSWHLSHCTLSLRCSFHFSSWWKPLPNRHNSLFMQPHFHGRRGRIWLNLFSPSVAGTHRILTGWRGLADSYIKGVTGPLYRSAPCLQQYWIISLCINCAAIVTCKRPKKGELNNNGRWTFERERDSFCLMFAWTIKIQALWTCAYLIMSLLGYSKVVYKLS